MSEMVEAHERAQRLSTLEKDMLLDFAGFETGKVVAGAAMWMVAKDFCRVGLMTGWPKASVTPFGRAVAEIIRDNMRPPQAEATP